MEVGIYNINVDYSWVLPITKRENEVAFETVQGYIAKEIADRMCISARTAETHLKNLKNKIGARNVADLVRIYIRSNKELFLSIFFTAIQTLSVINNSQIDQRKRKTARRSIKTTRVLKVQHKLV